MRMFLIIVLFITATNQFSAQSSFFKASDSINKNRVLPVSIGIAGGWAGSMIGLHKVWYKNVEKTNFHTFNDGANWLQMDKVGHVYTNYKISLLTGDLLKWSGVKPTTASLFGTGIGLGYQTTLEFLDAYSKDWGFSWYDVASNTAGAGIYLAQELAWNEQRFHLKFSYHPTVYADIRPEVLGSNFQERLLKDYNGQTYWMSFNPFLFKENSSFPKWICFSLGYSVNAKLVGDKEEYTFTTDTGPFTYYSQREWLLSLDIDFSRIPVKKPWLKTLLKQFNYVKLPFPALILRDGKLHGSALYF